MTFATRVAGIFLATFLFLAGISQASADNRVLIKNVNIFNGTDNRLSGRQDVLVEGEVNGTGLETSMDVVLRIDVIKDKTIAWPRLEDDEFIMVAGSARPLIDSFRLAHVELAETKL